MKIYNFLIKHRLLFALLSLLLSFTINYFYGFWPSFILYFLTLILVFSYFFFGPIRLIQQYMEAGDMEKAKKVLDSIKYPQLLYKPIRSVYYTVKGSLAMMDKDFDKAESHMKKSLNLGLPMKEAEGTNKLQLGMLAIQKNNFSQAESYIKQALKDGLADKDSKATALLQLSSIYANRRQFKASKDNFRKAKMLNSSNPEIKSQIKQMDKYISRMPS